MAVDTGAIAVDVTPSANRLTSSLRDIGYDFTAALADIVDNSVSAGASTVDVELVFDGPASYVLIADDGSGMSEAQLNEALRFGTRRTYDGGDLGRYGLGLKTASISQCRRLTVVTRRARTYRRLSYRSLDLDHISSTDRWEVIEPRLESSCYRALDWLNDSTGTVVLWEGLDRILPADRPESGWARRRLDQLASRSADYLGMVFHRYLEGDTVSGDRLAITVNGEKIQPWNAFAPDEEFRVELPLQVFEASDSGVYGTVRLRRFVLPPKNAFSSLAAFDRLSGPLKWNRQQGLYIYRQDRLIQSGGWCGIRAADEHTKFARAALDFATELDPLFRINVAKMRVLLPGELRTQLERPLHELCHRADSVYRREALGQPPVELDRESSKSQSTDALDVGAALIAAALDAGEHEALKRVMEKLRRLYPEVADALGW